MGNSVSNATTAAKAGLHTGRTRNVIERGVASQRSRRRARDGTGRRISAITRGSRLASGSGAASTAAVVTTHSTTRRSSGDNASGDSSPSSA